MKDIDFTKKEDKELITEYLLGEEEVLPILINRHFKSVYRFVFGFVLNESTAEDITQDIFIKVWKKLKSYDNKYFFTTWLFSIARNTTIDYLRKKKDVPFSRFENEEGDNILLDTLSDDDPLPDEALSKIQDIKVFKEMLEKLPILYREILILRYTDDLSIEEISKILKRPMETVKSQHRRGILHLKELIARTN